MLDKIKDCADLSIRRACGFAMLAIGTAAMGASYDAVLALKLSALCASAMGAILLLKAIQAPTHNYKRTEVWILLDKRHGLPEARAQQVIGGILHERYMWHARATWTGAVVLWLFAFALMLLRALGGLAIPSI